MSTLRTVRKGQLGGQVKEDPSSLPGPREGRAVGPLEGHAASWGISSGPYAVCWKQHEHRVEGSPAYFVGRGVWSSGSFLPCEAGQITAHSSLLPHRENERERSKAKGALPFANSMHP